MKYSSGELKKMARIALNGKWIYPILLSFIYTSVIMGLSIITSFFGFGTTTYAKILFWVASVIVSLISGLFGAGISYAYLNLCRGKTSTIKDLFIAFRMSPDRFLVVAFVIGAANYLGTLPTYLFPDALEENIYLYTLFMLVISLVTIIISCFFCLSDYLLLDFPEMGAFEALANSARLMKGNKGRFLWLSISFAGWMLLSIFTLFVSLIWIEPYMHMTLAFFYATILRGAGIYPPGEEPVEESVNEPIQEPVNAPVQEPTVESMSEMENELMDEIVNAPVQETTAETVSEMENEPIQVPRPEMTCEPIDESADETELNPERTNEPDTF